jgi:hypothetical protein
MLDVPAALIDLHSSSVLQMLRYKCCHAARRPGGDDLEPGQQEARGVSQKLTSAGCCCCSWS